MTRTTGRAPIAATLTALLLFSPGALAQFSPPQPQQPPATGSPFGAPPGQYGAPPGQGSPFGAPPGQYGAPPGGAASPFAPPPPPAAPYAAPGGPAADPFSALRQPPGGQPGQPAAPGQFGTGPSGPGPTMPGSPFGPPGGSAAPSPSPFAGPGGTPGARPPAGGQEHANLPPGVDVRRLQELSQQEKQDFGVRPPRDLHSGQMHAPTPTTIPGGKVIDTLNLVALLNQQSMRVVVVDALGGQAKLPNAIPAPFAGQSGSFQDRVQQQYGQLLRAATGGNTQTPLVVYCLDPNCWLSYNAAVRAQKLGYSNVFWYRGGIWAWQQAGMPVEQGEQQQQQPPPQRQQQRRQQ